MSRGNAGCMKEDLHGIKETGESKTMFFHLVHMPISDMPSWLTMHTLMRLPRVAGSSEKFAARRLGRFPEDLIT
jgi:hypothetical protein